MPLFFFITLLSPASAWVRSSPEATWPVGAVVTMQLRLGTSPPLIDGRTWDANAIEAMQTWNGCMHDLQLAWQTNGTTTASKHNRLNDLFFASDIYGEDWGANVLAVTTTWISGGTRIESDILFNKAEQWDAYRGSLRYPNGYGSATSEFRRVAMHELGHVLGLGHPDENEQWLSALMNSAVSDLDTLAEDDKVGIGLLYGWGPDYRPAPPIITSHPSSTDRDESDWAGFSVYATGTAPLHYQWRKDGIALTGATNSSFEIRSVAMTDAGDYSVEVTNAAGTTISNSARLTVHALEPPVFRNQPSNVTVTEGAYATISGWALGRHLTYQWKHDDALLPNSGNGILSFNPVTKVDAGVYTLTVTNAAGSVTSNPATLTVNSALPPRITEDPRSISTALGAQASFSVMVDGSSPLSYQWFKNGTAINWATSSWFQINSVSASDQGASFTVRVTNVAGEVTSAPASISVTMRPLNRTLQAFGGQVRLGSSLNLFSYINDPDATFQWFRNGAAIPGATSDSYALSNATLADAGEYLLRVTNPTGPVTSAPALVAIMPQSGPYEQSLAGSWLDIQKYSGIVYVLYAAPGRIERYDLAAGQWLPSVLLPRAATAFRVGADGVYIAFGQNLSLFTTAIAGEMAIARTERDTTMLVVASSHIYAFSGESFGRITVIDKRTGGAVRTVETFYTFWPTLAFAPTSHRIYAASQWLDPSDVGYLALGDEGTIASFLDTPYHGAFPKPTRVFLAPGEDLLADNGGILYRTSDLKLVAGLGGPLQDVAFLAAGGAVVLRSNRLHRLDTAWRETGVATFAAVGDRLFVNGSDAVVFTQASTAGGPIGVTRVALSSLLPRPPAEPIDVADLAYSPDDVTVDREGTVLLTSRLHRNVFRWSTNERKYLTPATLTGTPSYVAYSDSANELLVAYPDGRITSKPSTTGAETGRGATPLGTTGLASAGDVIFAADASGAWASHYTIAQDGTLLSRVDWNYYSRVYTWSAVNRRLFQFRDDTPNSLRFEEINANGMLGAPVESPDDGAVNAIPPIRVSPDGQFVLLGSGQLYSGTTLQRVGALANAIDDGDWVGGRLTTIRVGLTTSELQQWSDPGFTQTRSVETEGYPLRLVTLPNGQLLAVTLVKQRPRFTLFDDNLNLIYQSPTSALASIAAHPVSTFGMPGNTLDLAVSAAGEGPLTYQWFRNGTQIAGATNATLALGSLAPLQAGLYDCAVSANGSSALSHPAVVGLTLPAGERTAGGVSTRPAWQDIHHPNGAIYDQFLLTGAAGTFTADPGQIARCSYLDSNDSIVQVEMSGAGAITIVLDNATGPMAPALYNQSGIEYMQGKATIILAGADSTTHFTIYSVGTATNPGVTRSDVAYAGWADVAVAGIVSSGGGLGGIHQGNVSYNATLGYTGLYAPTVNSVGGPVVVHAIAASDHALPYLYFAPGSQIEVKVAGGALAQSVGDSITVGGLSHVTMGAGQDSCGRAAPAQTIQTRLVEDNGTDVTTSLVTGP
ncbi:MAG: immunoglobulin domain-containing protein [Opitutaceae bacterium]|nr:immunoglobulin domain-containing protein [Opitutaceae bacterium]